MIYDFMSEHIKGVGATIATGATATFAWLSAIELVLRIGVSAVGIAAGIYACRYWHKRAKLLDLKSADPSELE